MAQIPIETEMPIDTQSPDEAPVEVMPAIGLPKTPFNIGRKKETRIYYRPHRTLKGEQIYIPTTLLPADAWHMMYYARKGFKLWPPGQEPGQESQAMSAVSQVQDVSLKAKQEGKVLNISCPVAGCTKIVHSYIGLSRHMATAHNQK